MGLFLILGLSLGTAQALFFSAHVKGAWYWVVFNMLASLAMSLVALCIAIFTNYIFALPFWIGTTLQGTVLGIFTGIALVNFTHPENRLSLRP